MSIIDRINQQTLLITNQETKKRLLKELTKEKKVIPIKFMTLEEFVSSYFFDVSIEGYLFLLEKEKKKVSIIEEEISQLIYIVAFLSINVGFINILPFPAFDGGRILFLVIEKIKGSPVKPETENMIHNIGFILLMILMVYITFNDIIRFF